MAEWRKRRLKIKRVLDMLKDQLGRGFAFATSSFPGMHLAIVMATSHDECPPDERHVQTILAAGTGSRLRVSYCTKALVKRLTKTQNWAVALKSLIVLHRTLHEGGFLFQDHLSFFSNGSRDYLNLSGFKDDSGPVAWGLSSWVRRYARFLDERLICSRVLGSAMDSKGADSGERMPYLATGEILEHIFSLQALLQEVFQCEVDGIAAENDVVLVALRLVVRDSYIVQGELHCRFQEMMQRLDVLQLSEALQLLQVCRKASEQTARLLELYEVCEATGGIPEASQTPPKVDFTDSDLKKVTEAIKAASEQPSFKSLLRAGSHKGSLNRLSFSIASKKHASDFRRSRSSSSSSQLFGRESQATTRVSSRGQEGSAVQQGATDVLGTAARGGPSSSGPVPPDHLTGNLVADESLEGQDRLIVSTSGTLIQMNGQPHMSTTNVVPLGALLHGERKLMLQAAVQNSQTLTSTFPDTRLSLHRGPVFAVESTQSQDWERTLMESVGTLDPRANPSSWSQGRLLINPTAASPATIADSQLPWRPPPTAAGAWEHLGSANFVPPIQQRLQRQESVQRQQMTAPVWAPKTLFPDYFAGLWPNQNGLADMPR